VVGPVLDLVDDRGRPITGAFLNWLPLVPMAT
jgi:hypothetical protein